MPHAVMEVRNTGGDLIWRFDRDGRKPLQVLSPQVAADMNVIMNKVVEEGTARRAIIDGIKSAGKTGTTNAYRDAWFVGYTGNFVCGVWFGNDDYAPLNPHDRRLAAGDDLAGSHGTPIKGSSSRASRALRLRCRRRGRSPKRRRRGRRGAHSGLDAARAPTLCCASSV